ncbi:MAG: LysR family transcriptional regulator [Rhodobacteraceae bacterium]|nr:LysR family transcriptional regulator [Paracoccaceae bacterium]MBR9821039.1 LysR family transcriptional regulator [Paracoccaceae bacterium]
MVNINTFDLNLLRVFEAVYRERSVTEAAHVLGLSQPAVSNALKRLRDQLSEKLFIRTRLGLEPTPAGERLFHAISSGMDAIRSGIVQSASFDPASSERMFRIVMTDVGAAKFLPGILRTMEERAPRIRLDIAEADADRIEGLLDTGAADLAIGRLRLKEELRSQLMDVSSPVVLLREGHPAITQRPEGAVVRLEDYFRARHILVNPRGASANPLLRVFEKNGVSARQQVVTMKTLAAVPYILRQTDLVATVPEGVIEQMTAGGGLAYFPLPFDMERNYVYLWWHERNMADPAHVWLRNLFDAQRVKLRPGDLDLKG